jgi:hypothetical protein
MSSITVTATIDPSDNPDNESWDHSWVEDFNAGTCEAANILVVATFVSADGLETSYSSYRTDVPVWDSTDPGLLETQITDVQDQLIAAGVIPSGITLSRTVDKLIDNIA